MLPLIERAADFADRVAIVDEQGSYTYRQLLEASAAVAAVLLDGRTDLEQRRVAFLVPPSFGYVAVQWGIWRSGGIAVPLATMHPPAELKHALEDAQVDALVVDPSLAANVDPVRGCCNERYLRLDELLPAAGSVSPSLPDVTPDRAAMMLYTSGTTSRPKGVVTTHANLTAQITTLVQAWEWTADDRILNFLPLHHVHGIINVLSCALWSGACCEFMPKFDAVAVWNRLAQVDAPPLTLFMAVPTIYARLIAAWEAAGLEEQQAWSAACRKLRLMVSGSAALPVSTLERWQAISGHVLLERYGMTEIGMAISNPLHGERRPGFVGMPLPGVDIRLTDEAGNDVPVGTPGEIVVRGPGVFKEYWNRPDATAASFRDGWFLTGDVAVLENGYYRILGRNSVDIIKTGGYKVSALEIEEVLRTHPAIAECAVVGVPHEEWGEAVAACVVPRQTPDAASQLALEPLRAWAKQHLAVYKVPHHVLVVDQLPRNAMGKVQKPAVVELFAG